MCRAATRWLDFLARPGQHRREWTCSFCGQFEWAVGLHRGPDVASCRECVEFLYADVDPPVPKEGPNEVADRIVAHLEPIEEKRPRSSREE